MDSKEFIQRQIAIVRRLSDAMLSGLTDDQINWTPPGTANPISATIVHMLAAEDSAIQMTLKGVPRIWEADRWREKIGIAAVPSRGGDWSEFETKKLRCETLLAYGLAVREASDKYLAELDGADLDRHVEFMGGERPLGEVFAQIVAHAILHIGEIAAVKGMQGIKGLPG